KARKKRPRAATFRAKVRGTVSRRGARAPRQAAQRTGPCGTPLNETYADPSSPRCAKKEAQAPQLAVEPVRLRLRLRGGDVPGGPGCRRLLLLEGLARFARL